MEIRYVPFPLSVFTTSQALISLVVMVFRLCVDSGESLQENLVLSLFRAKTHHANIPKTLFLIPETASSGSLLLAFVRLFRSYIYLTVGSSP